MNFGIYCRKSYFVDTSESTQMQLTKCKEHIDQRFSEVSSISFYEDDGYVRSDMDRPGMNQLKEDIAAGLIDCVVIYKIDRVCSDMMDFCTFYSYLREHEIKFITVRDGIDTTTPLGEAMMYLAVIFSGLEVRTDSLRITDNMNHLAASGFWCGGQAPVGYDITTIDLGSKSHKTLIFNQEEIDYKNNLIDIFLENSFSLQSMETYCKNNRITSLKGNFLSTTQLYNIFTSPHCVQDTPAMYDYFEAKGCMIDENSPREKWDGHHGIIVYGRTMEKRVNGKKRHTLAPPEKWRVSIGFHEPYLTDQRYFSIMAQFGHNTFSKVAKYDLPLLKGVIRCKCGRTMSMSRKKKVDGSVSTWYYCPKRMRAGAEACDMRQIKADLLDGKVLDVFKEIQHNPATVKKYLKDGKRPARDSSAAVRAQMETCQEKIGKLTAALAVNNESAAAKYIIGEIEKLDIEYNTLKSKLLNFAAEERRAAAQMKSAMEKREAIIRLLDNFDSFTANERNEIAKNVLKECTWDGETLFIML